MYKKALTAISALALAALLASCSSTSSSSAAPAPADSATPTAASVAAEVSAAADIVSEATESTVEAASAAASDASGSERVFTVEELAEYDGKDGQPAYVAVDGVVYDVTDVPQWANGEHANGLTAGQDLTDEITNDSPHGLGVLDGLPVAGTLA